MTKLGFCSQLTSKCLLTYKWPNHSSNKGTVWIILMLKNVFVADFVNCSRHFWLVQTGNHLRKWISAQLSAFRGGYNEWNRTRYLSDIKDLLHCILICVWKEYIKECPILYILAGSYYKYLSWQRRWNQTLLSHVTETQSTYTHWTLY